MQIYRRGRAWWVSYYARGVRVRRSLGKISKAEALKMADAIGAARHASTYEQAVEILREVYEGDAGAGAIRLDAAWDTYMQTVRAVGRDSVAESTLKHRREYLRRLVAWLAAERPRAQTVDAVDAATATAYAAHLGTVRNPRGDLLTVKTRKDHINELRGMWRLLAKADPRIANVWDGLSPTGGGADSEVREPFTEEQERRVLEAAERVGKGWPLACLIARHTGLRYGDVANLEWAEVDLARGVLKHKPHKTARHGVTVEIPLVAPLLAALKAAREAPGANAEMVLPLHAAMYGGSRWAKSKALSFREVLDAAGISGNYTFHSWRHTAATRMAEAGVGEETRKAILGHTTAAMAEHYDHSQRIAAKREALEKAMGR